MINLTGKGRVQGENYQFIMFITVKTHSADQIVT